MDYTKVAVDPDFFIHAGRFGALVMRDEDQPESATAISDIAGLGSDIGYLSRADRRALIQLLIAAEQQDPGPDGDASPMSDLCTAQLAVNAAIANLSLLPNMMAGQWLDAAQQAIDSAVRKLGMP